MGNWYRVTKKINGRLYDYWQRTERHGKQVKTFNKYIGRASGTTPAPLFSASEEADPRPLQTPDEKPTFKPETLDAKEDPEYSRADKLEIRALKRQQQQEFGAAMKVENAKVRQAKRNSKGTGAINPFLGQGIKHHTRTYYRGGGTGSMPKGLTAAEILKYETEQLGNHLNLEPGVDAKTIKSERLIWLTTTEKAAKHYGTVEPVTGNFGSWHGIMTTGC